MRDRSRQLERAEQKAELARRSAEAVERSVKFQEQVAKWVVDGEGDNPPAMQVLYEMLHDKSVLTVTRYDKEGNVVSETQRPRVSDDLRMKVAIELMNQARMGDLIQKGLGIKTDKTAQSVTNHTTYAQFNFTPEQIADMPEHLRDQVADQQLRLIRGETLDGDEAQSA